MLILTTFIIVGSLIGMIGYFNSVSNDTYLKKNKDKGSYNYAVSEITAEQKEFFKKYTTVKDENTLSIYGESEYGYIGSIDSTSLFVFSMYDGKLPEKDNEIAIDHVTLINMGYSEDLNQIINISYTTLEGNEITKSYSLCGIVNRFTTLTEKPKLITTPTNDSIKEYYYFKGSINYNDFWDDETLYNQFQQYQNIFTNRTMYYKRANTNLTFELIVVIMFLSMILSYINMNRIVGNQRNQIILLRGIGAKKSQITIWMFGQILILSIIGLLLGFIAGFGISYIAVKKAGIAYYIDTELIIEYTILVLLPIIFGVIFPTLKAMNVPLTGRFENKVRKIHSNGSKMINSRFLITRRLSLHLFKSILMILAASLSMTLIIVNGIKILNQQPVRNWKYQDYVYDYHVSGSNQIDSEGNEIPAKPLTTEDLTTIRNLSSVTDIYYMGYSNEKIDLGRENAYIRGCYAGYSELNDKAYGRICTLDFYQSDFLDQYEIDLEEYNKGNIVMIFLPEDIYFDEGYFDYLNINIFTIDTKYYDYPHSHKVLDETIHVGDHFEYNGKQITIGAIITDITELPIDLREPYSIIASSALLATPDDYEHSIALNADGSVDEDVMIAKLQSLYSDRNICSEVSSHEYTNQYIFEGYQKLAAYVIGGFVVLILVIYEYMNDIENTRKNTIAIFHLVGMSYKEIRKMLMIDYLSMIVSSILLSFILGFYNQFTHLSSFGLFVSYPKSYLYFVIIVYSAALIISTLLYIFKVNRILRENNSLKAKE